MLIQNTKDQDKAPGRHRNGVAIFFLLVLLVLGWTANTAAALGQAQGRINLTLEHIPSSVSDARLLGRMDRKEHLTFEMILPYRNQRLLDELLHRLYDPGDPVYGHYLTPSQFTARFGPAQADVDVVVRFAREVGLKVEEISANRTSVKVSGTVQAIEHALGIQLNLYVSAQGRRFYALDREPVLPSAVADRLLAVIGLHNAGELRPASRQSDAFGRNQKPSGEGPLRQSSDRREASISLPQAIYYSGNQGLAPSDIRAIYNLPSAPYNGSGQVLGLFELGTFTPGDITAYEKYYKLPQIPLKIISVDGYNTNSKPGYAAGEVTLDIELMAALAPGASQIRVYEGTDDYTTFHAWSMEVHDIFAAMANDSIRANVISVSYDQPEAGYASADIQAENQALQQLASQGQTVCVAAGDAGAYGDQSGYPSEAPNCFDPATQPYVLSVGGTDLTDSPSYGYVSETSWADPSDHPYGNYGTGGGGGISGWWSIPSWQVGAFKASVNPQGSLTMRNIPDVALYGDYNTGGYDIYFTDPTHGAGFYGFNGTSATSPLWAAFLANVNQARKANGLPVIGFANPVLYSIAESSAYASDFHDIKDGSTNLYYKAVQGYDNSTGWGSFIGANLLKSLSSQKSPPKPIINSFSPPNGPIGTVVTIAGTNFTGATSVKFNGTAATTFTVVSSTSITATVPTGATTGTISVTTPGGTATSTARFTVTPPAKPTIKSFTPPSGQLGTVVTITGTNFTGATAVKFNGIAATTFSVVSATSITATVPTGATTGTISVTTPGGTATSSAKFTVTTTSSGISISGNVFNDQNGNGKQDSGEGALSGWTVYIDLKKDFKLDPGDPKATTDSNGNYTITGLNPGTYYVEVVPVTGWHESLPAARYGGWSITLTAGKNVTGLQFGWTQTCSILGYVYDDLNSIGQYVNGDPAISGCTVFIDLNGSGMPNGTNPTTTTDSTGIYEFDGLTTGTYDVYIVVQSNWLLTQPAAPYDGYAVPLTTSGQVSGYWPFGVFVL